MSDIYLSLTETPTVVTLSQPVVSGVLSSNVTVTNVVSVNVVTMPAINVTAAAPSVTTVAGTVAVSNFPAVTTVAGTVALDANSLSALENVTVTVGAAVSVSNFPSTQTIAGTVTANLDSNNFNGALTSYVEAVSSHNAFPVEIAYQPSVTIGSLPAISGTVTVGGFSSVSVGSGAILVAGSRSGDAVPLVVESASGRLGVSLVQSSGPSIDPISQTNGLWVRQANGSSITVSNSVTIGSLPAISGTVTANSIFPRVTLIDGSGTVATANTAITVFASSSTRSYLLVQVTTGSAFVNVGATATTVNGINLTAGQGYSWETTIPQGIVSLISTTTNSRYVAKEA